MPPPGVWSSISSALLSSSETRLSFLHLPLSSLFYSFSLFTLTFNRWRVLAVLAQDLGIFTFSVAASQGPVWGCDGRPCLGSKKAKQPKVCAAEGCSDTGTRERRERVRGAVESSLWSCLHPNKAPHGDPNVWPSWLSALCLHSSILQLGPWAQWDFVLLARS